MIFSHYHSTRARRELNAFQSLKSNLGFFKHSNQICVYHYVLDLNILTALKVKLQTQCQKEMIRLRTIL